METKLQLKQLIDITDDDIITVINRMFPLTTNTIISRNGFFGLGFKESYKKYGSAYIDVKLASIDKITDGQWTSIYKCRIQFKHNSIWFNELNEDDEPTGNNKNIFFGYLKLQELGYELPTEPQW